MHNRKAINNKNLVYISTTRLDKDFKAMFHSHPNLEILLFVEGTGYIQTTSEKIPVNRGSVAIINAHCNHCEIGKTDLAFYAIGISKTSVYSKADYKSQILHFELSDDGFSDVKGLYECILRESNKNDPFSGEIIDHVQNALLSIVINRQALLAHASELKESDLVSNVKKIIDYYYFQPLQLKAMATRLSISTSTLCHKFKMQTGKTIVQYKIEKQLEEARNLLKISDMEISEIAFAVGFNSSSYFEKVFKKAMGMTPKIYRKQAEAETQE